MIKVAPDMLDAGRQAQIRDTLSRDGWVHIPNFLDDAYARRIVGQFQSLPWLSTFRDGKTVKEIAPEKIAKMDMNERRMMIVNMHRQAVSDFQYFYDTFRLSIEHKHGRFVDGPLADFMGELNAPDSLSFMAAITGDDRIANLDAQATRYIPGHFLSEHDDTDSEKARLFAYVLNLSPQWRTDWGGMLTFTNERGDVLAAFPPRWNALNIFSVPRRHAVTLVTPFAGAARHSITGWMRTKA